jgi:hypothetical protein
MFRKRAAAELVAKERLRSIVVPTIQTIKPPGCCRKPRFHKSEDRAAFTRVCVLRSGSPCRKAAIVAMWRKARSTTEII